MNYNNAMFYFPVRWLMQDYQAFDDALEADELEKFLKLNWWNPSSHVELSKLMSKMLQPY